MLQSGDFILIWSIYYQTYVAVGWYQFDQFTIRLMQCCNVVIWYQYDMIWPMLQCDDMISIWSIMIRPMLQCDNLIYLWSDQTLSRQGFPAGRGLCRCQSLPPSEPFLLWRMQTPEKLVFWLMKWPGLL